MKKYFGILLTVLLISLVACALAGGAPVHGSIVVGDLQNNTEMDGDTVLTIDEDRELGINSEGSIRGNYVLTFRGAGHFLRFDTSSGPAVQAKDVRFENCHILIPANGKVKNGTICESSGEEAGFVIIGPENYYGIEVYNGTASDKNDPYGVIYYATAGTEILFRISNEECCPEGKYVSRLDCIPDQIEKELNQMDFLEDMYITMPAAPVTVVPVFTPQENGVLDMRSGKLSIKGKDGLDLFHTIEMSAHYGSTHGSLVKGYDLDGDGSPDLRLSDTEITVPSSCSVPVSAVVTVSRITRYGTLAVVFNDPTVSFNANGGTGSMSAVTITASNLKYKLPECTFTPPAGKEFDKWDKGAPGTEITVTANTVITAQWKNKAGPKNEVTVSGGVYKLNHSKKTATFIKAARKAATKLTIKDTVSANGKTYKVTEIKAKACRGMKKLAAVTIGKNVTKIGRQAFEKCAKLKKITIKNAKMKKAGFGSKCFSGISAKVVFKVPAKALKNYTKWIRNPGKAPKTAKIKK